MPAATNVIPFKKRCTRCAVVKPGSAFYIDRTHADGRASMCKHCRDTASKRHRITARATVRGRCDDLIKEGKKRARRKRMTWSLTREWLLLRLETGACEATGLKFVLTPVGGAFRHPRCPSIHRVDNRRGYEPDNCQLVICQFNAALNEWDEELFAEMCAAYLMKKSPPGRYNRRTQVARDSKAIKARRTA